MPFLAGLSSAELAELVGGLGQPAYRGKQVARWIYKSWVRSVDEMTDLPAALRLQLGANHQVMSSEVAHTSLADDGVQKLLLRLPDGDTVETVYLPYEDRVSVCLSTQVGCPAGCAFCATGLSGFSRNLTPGEIVEQYLWHQGLNPNRRISHVVFMGMGEPLFNYSSTVAAIRLLTGEIGLSARSITVSTVGVVPGILQLAEEGIPVNLALSLHAPDDELRTSFMPTGRKWPIAEILAACRTYRTRTGRDVTFEYVLMDGVNDSPEHASRLCAVLDDLPGVINLIPFNSVSSSTGFGRPSGNRIAAFRRSLERRSRAVTQRAERGASATAACGQLRRAVGGEA